VEKKDLDARGSLPFPLPSPFQRPQRWASGCQPRPRCRARVRQDRRDHECGHRASRPLAEEDYMRLLKMALEPKDRLVLQAGCQHNWPCYGKPATIFHDRGKIFTSERARQVLVDRLGIITEQAPPYCPSAKGTVQAIFRWMTQRVARRLPNTSFGTHDAEVAAEAGGMTLEELERYARPSHC
jgi:hypothetical protein